MAYQLLTKYATDTGIKAAVDKFDYYIIPVLNPDGESAATRSDHQRTSLMRSRFRLHPDHQPPVAQEPPDPERKLLRRPRPQPQLALQVGGHRWCLDRPLLRDVQGSRCR